MTWVNESDVVEAVVFHCIQNGTNTFSVLIGWVNR